MGIEGFSKKTSRVESKRRARPEAVTRTFEGAIDIKTATRERLEEYLAYLEGRRTLLRMTDKDEDADTERLIGEVKDEMRQ